MFDLFGEVMSINSRSLINPEHGFNDWWNSYKCPQKRKNQKPYCKNWWIKHRLAEQSSQVILYAEWLANAEQFEFLPGPKPFLRAAGWIDWEPPKEKKKDTWTEDFEAHCKKAVPMPEHLRRRLTQ